MNDINDKNKIAKCKMQKKRFGATKIWSKKDLVQQRFDLKNKK